MRQKKINKKFIIGRLVEVPESGKRPFWQKEMTLLKKLEEKYSLEFLDVLFLPKKLKSLAILFNEDVAKDIDTRFKNFNYKPKDYSEFSCNVSENKFDKDKQYKKQTKSIKDFLNE